MINVCQAKSVLELRCFLQNLKQLVDPLNLQVQGLVKDEHLPSFLSTGLEKLQANLVAFLPSLIFSVKHGLVEMLRELLQFQLQTAKKIKMSPLLEVEKTDFFGYTPLHYCALLNKPACAAALLEYGARIETQVARNKSSFTNYLFMKENKDMKRLEQLLLQGDSALDIAIKLGNLEVVEVIVEAIEAGFKAKTMSLVSLRTLFSKTFQNSVKYAAEHGHGKLIAGLIRAVQRLEQRTCQVKGAEDPLLDLSQQLLNLAFPSDAIEQFHNRRESVPASCKKSTPTHVEQSALSENVTHGYLEKLEATLISDCKENQKHHPIKTNLDQLVDLAVLNDDSQSLTMLLDHIKGQVFGRGIDSIQPTALGSVFESSIELKKHAAPAPKLTFARLETLAQLAIRFDRSAALQKLLEELVLTVNEASGKTKDGMNKCWINLIYSAVELRNSPCLVVLIDSVLSHLDIVTLGRREMETMITCAAKVGFLDLLSPAFRVWLAAASEQVRIGKYFLETVLITAQTAGYDAFSLLFLQLLRQHVMTEQMVLQETVEGTTEERGLQTCLDDIRIGTLPLILHAAKFGLVHFLSFCHTVSGVDWNVASECLHQTSYMVVKDAATFDALVGVTSTIGVDLSGKELSLVPNVEPIDFDAADQFGCSFVKYLLQTYPLQGEEPQVFQNNSLCQLAVEERCSILETMSQLKCTMDINKQCNIADHYTYPQWFTCKDLKLLRHLIKYFHNKVDLNLRDSLGMTYFYRCVQLEWYSSVEYLLCVGEKLELDVNVADHEGWNALLFYCRYNKLKQLIVLLKAELQIPLNLNAVTEAGYSALTIAAAYGHIGVLKLLLHRRDLKIDLEHKANGYSALEIAKINGHKECAKFLKKFGPTSNKQHFIRHEPGIGSLSLKDTFAGYAKTRAAHCVITTEKKTPWKSEQKLKIVPS